MRRSTTADANVVDADTLRSTCEIRHFKAIEQERFEREGEGFRVRAMRKTSTFAKYQGIGNPRIGTGRKNIGRWLRDMRGE